MSRPVSRRGVLQVVGAGAASAGASACSRGPRENIVPYVNQPPEVTPSKPSWYATVFAMDGHAVGILAESHEGRPTKLEGNPHHPASAGALSAIEQASLYDLYDPKRMHACQLRGEPRTWEAFASVIAAQPPPGKQTHVVLEPTTSPHLVDLVRRVRALGHVVVHFDSAVSRRNGWAGAKLAFGRVVETLFDFSRADVVLSLDSDFLSGLRSPHAWTRQWASRRTIDGPGESMSRLYVVEPRLTVTGMSADERLPLQGRQIEGLAADLLGEIAVQMGGPNLPGRPAPSKWVCALARDLVAHAGACIVLVGDSQPQEVHALAHAVNETLGNVGHTVTYGPPSVFEAGEPSHGLEGLVRSIDEGQVATLVVIGGDPVYAAPSDLELARRVASIPSTAYLGLRQTRTARACAWNCAEAHWLEVWGDAVAFDGTPAIAQPLIRPIADGRSAGQVLGALLGRTDVSSQELVRDYWRTRATGDFDDFWRQSLVRGIVPTGRTPVEKVSVDWRAIARLLTVPTRPAAQYEIAFFADAKVYDGRFGDNAWLQELPDPVTKLTWDNAALVSRSVAERLGAEDGDVLALQVRGRTLEVPVIAVPGMGEGVIALALGYGRQVPDHDPVEVGVDAYSIRDSRGLWFDDAVVRRTSTTRELAFAQEHGDMEDRPIVLRRTLAEYRHNPDFAKPLDETPDTLYELAPDAPHQWGMTIDLNACTGCSACVTACMVENNVPTVGRGGVRLGRGMYWMRIDRYYVGRPRDASVVVQPMLCQHCEKAPCEYVCPVNATVHSHDGLNEMIYNRCVGTRFCSNNCPYKVRRFNFFNYNVDKPETLALAMNPDVTVRARGVMEKCTYCVQRIREAEIASRREQRPLADGEIVTACQQTCPSGAITFGDIADPKTAVSAKRRGGRVYEVLHTLGTLPRTKYLARIVNPNPEASEA